MLFSYLLFLARRPALCRLRCHFPCRCHCRCVWGCYRRLLRGLAANGVEAMSKRTESTEPLVLQALLAFPRSKIQNDSHVVTDCNLRKCSWIFWNASGFVLRHSIQISGQLHRKITRKTTIAVDKATSASSQHCSLRSFNDKAAGPDQVTSAINWRKFENMLLYSTLKNTQNRHCNLAMVSHGRKHHLIGKRRCWMQKYHVGFLLCKSAGVQNYKLYQHRPQIAKTNFCGINVEKKMSPPTIAHYNGSTPTPQKLVVTLQHTALAPCNGTTYSSKVGRYFPHPAIAPRPLPQS